jgi:hypothetical protein
MSSVVGIFIQSYQPWVGKTLLSSPLRKETSVIFRAANSTKYMANRPNWAHPDAAFHRGRALDQQVQPAASEDLGIVGIASCLGFHPRALYILSLPAQPPSPHFHLPVGSQPPPQEEELGDFQVSREDGKYPSSPLHFFSILLPVDCYWKGLVRLGPSVADIADGPRQCYSALVLYNLCVSGCRGFVLAVS